MKVAGWRLAFLMTALALPGCKAGDETLVPVAGKVTVDDKPLTTGSVSFRPDRGKGNEGQHHPTGVIDPSGNFELMVPPARKGAPPGWYKVVVVALDNPQPGKPLKSFIDMKYSREEDTPLTIEVIAQPEPGRYDLKLSR